MYLGEIAALTASLLWSASSSIFTFAGREVGAITLNRLRLLAAMLLLTLAHLIFGIPLPLAVEPERWAWLALSGVIGLTIGDALLFSALVRIGPRLSMLINALNPAIAALLAWLILGEVLSGVETLGMLLTLSGVTWVMLDRRVQPRSDQPERRDYLLGASFALGSAFTQALALVIAKPGLAGDFPPLSATWMRMLAGAAVMWAVTLLSGQAGQTFARLRARPRATWLILGGATAGPFLGVTLSMVAIQNSNIGVASTLMGLAPVFLLPVGRFVFKETFSWQSVAGTLLAVVGIGMLFR